MDEEGRRGRGRDLFDGDLMTCDSVGCVGIVQIDEFFCKTRDVFWVNWIDDFFRHLAPWYCNPR